ncbi:MAG: GAF domain-containing protein [Oxalobacteraceae bacterium]|nr:MAG: GAF domain-containing protein [Oxalobacteraceae bacterium]
MTRNPSHGQGHAVKAPDPTAWITSAPGNVTPPESSEDLLRRSITEVLRLIREDLAMDMVLITIHVGDTVVISHAAAACEEANIIGVSCASDSSICERVLEGRLPAVIPDMAALKRTHDVPVTPIIPAAFMAVPIVLSCGTRYGVLCCLNSTPMLELEQRQHRRLQMSAQHIARLVDDAG